MRKWLTRILIVVAALGLLAGGGIYIMYRSYYVRVHGSLPTRVTDATLLKYRESVRQAQGTNLKGKDFAGATAEALYAVAFDTKTAWPSEAKLPPGFNPSGVLEAGKDPGLGLRGLHKQGLTGRGVVVAVIDKPMLAAHREFTGRIKYVEVYPGHEKNRTLHFHGAAVASILAGATVGVAPESSLYYFAVPDNGKNFPNYTEALNQILRLNATLPPAERIRVVSISDGFGPDEAQQPEKAAYLEAVRKAEESGIVVIHCAEPYPLPFSVAGAMPGRNRDDAESYDPWLMTTRLAPGQPPTRDLLLPGDYRTTASNADTEAYGYWGEGGRSWTAPYLAGVVALGLQVNADKSPDDVRQALADTATETAKGLRLVNPAGFIERMRL